MTDVNTMVTILTLISSKLDDIPKNADLSRNFCYVTLWNPHFCMSEPQ